MSLIFNALKRNRTGPSAAESSSGKAAPQRKAISLRTLISSPVVILLLASTIFLSGIAVSYLVQSFSVQGAPDSSSIRAEVPQYTAFVPDPDASAQSAARSSVRSEPEVASPAVQPADLPFEDIGAPKEVEEPGGGPTGFAVELPAAAAADTGSPDTPIGAQTAMPKQNAAASSATSPSPDLAFIHPRKSAMASATTDARMDFSTVQAQDSPPPPTEKSALEIQRERRAKEHLQTNRLAGRIIGAMQSGDQDAVGRLFAELEKLKGRDHLFVLKLKAYWMIQQGRPDQARTLLSNVLIQRPDDCEAGLNMAVVDIMEGYHSRARERLERLQQLYPEETAVSGYLSQLAP
jgi:hypothetical protein